MHAIIAKDLTRVVRDADRSLAIVDGLCFTVPKACSFCVTGPSGSGKSSLLSLLAGLDLPSAGSLEILGKNIATLSEEQRTRFRGQHLGFVFQNHQLLHQLTALENIMLPLEIQGLANARAQAIALLDEVGLSDRAHHYPSTLSGGEQQRVGLARAFAIRPQLLLADEPTGSLDAQTGQRIANLMFDLNRSHGTTLVLVTHDEGLAARCDEGIRLSAGRATPR
ncbi:MAG: ATP-binding cassette domain-containing protein [Betaproteobacteria bacterium]|jgi:putative ABC transport system ATP-binding protein|nr:ATP-binding cassette domain-containing protein [Pseudomonadota bacterium]NBO03485.1 ATP-binding cassette domain-containing protein [Betaproteobacteria bacterium]NBO96647.1 ATP-binding cassette domain-containing protein [Betaproteobacteria bacterium]NBP35510.1 ATP-binding cassette domain-containing protein [Betaproteobacteria bacterium]NBP38287.1 ATP-binding cassette domain-containing protein [Betaproteobacteria bacterium]